ncbi:MAG: RNA polymerase sigma factor [Acidobacteria bacterium]|nr:RNA polymerase sigma factor [Acidobacteriota bacterium]
MGRWVLEASPCSVSAQPEEIELVQLARSGDRSAFETLYRRNAGRIYGLCLRLTGRAAEAEDMTQEAFIRAWQKIDSFEGRSLFSSWLHRLAVNVVLNDRRGRPSPDEVEPIGDHEAIAARATTTGARAGGGDLEAAIARLPEGARHVFVLHEVYGYTHEEIAAIAGIAEGTSKAHLHRARSLLKEALKS